MPAESEQKDEPKSKVALSDSEERFRLLIDSLQDYSVFPLSVEGRVSNWNLGAARLKGYETQEAIGLHISRFFPREENAERVPERLLARAEVEGRAEYEGWLVRKDRSQFWGTVILGAMRDQEGRLRGFSNVARDLTERKKVEKAQSFLIEAGGALTGSLDYEHTLQEVARLAVYSMADWCTVAVQGANGLAVVSAAHLDPARESRTRELLRVLPRSELKLTRGIGHVVRTGQSDLCSDTLEAAWVRPALGVDTPERLMELGVRSFMCVPLKARDEFLSMASHDLRSPLTSLRLQLQAVRKDMQQDAEGARAKEKLATRVESMVRQTDRMLHMMDALMDISQMTAGRLELKRHRLDLVELVRGAVNTLDEELRQSGVELRVHAQGPVEGTWDRLRLEQVIDNLLSNAVKYGKGQPVDLTVSKDGNMAKLVVRDQGVGIAPEDQGRLFDRFERVRLDQDVTGYGVGLWVVRRVVEAHGGTVTIESRLGEGSSFTVRLPLRDPADTQPGRPREKDPEGRPAAFH